MLESEPTKIANGYITLISAHKAECKCTDRAEHQTEQDQLLPPEFIGQRASNHAPDQAEE